MEGTSWEQKSQALTHILINPTTTPSLHSQFFISTQIPCYLNWDYPPLLCPKFQHPSSNLRWAFSLFLKRVSTFGVPLTSWRSKCPYLQPPPLVLAQGVEEPKWDDDDGKIQCFRKRMSRKKLMNNVNPLIPVLVPNVLLLSLLLWNPFPEYDQYDS